MESFNNILGAIADAIWGTSLSTFGIGGGLVAELPFIVILLLGTGLYLMIRLRFMPIWGIPAGFANLWRGRKTDGQDGEVTPFAALATALSSTVGTGNIAGVATAIAIGGPGAIFWMWMTAIVGTATKYSESLLAVRFREVDADGTYKGGPMYSIKNGLGPKWMWLAVLFCIGALASSAGAGNMAQGNSIAEVMDTSFGIPTLVTGLVLAGLTFAIIIGGIKSIGRVASKLVPFMGVGYVIIAFIVLMLNLENVPEAFASIFDNAFGGRAAVGGFTGAVISQAIQLGVARGLFSNEAGQGSAPIAHAAAQTKDPVAQAKIAMLGTFIDTLVICTMTALIILSVKGNFTYNPALKQMQICETADIVSFTGDEMSVVRMSADELAALSGDALAQDTAYRASAVEKLRVCEADGTIAFAPEAYAGVTDLTLLPADYAWQSDRQSSSITAGAFENGIPGGQYFIAIALLVFAFTTILGWSYYGERAIAFLVGERAVFPFRIVWCLVVFAGAVLPVQAVWTMGDIGNGLMATPNLIAVLLLSGVVVAVSRGDKPKRVMPFDQSAAARGDMPPPGAEDMRDDYSPVSPEKT